MEDYREELSPSSGDPREVVECYRYCPPAEEVVERYESGYVLPGYRHAPPQRRSKKGFFIFLGALAILAALVTAWYLLRDRPVHVRGEVVEQQTARGEITMETYPTGGDVRLTLHPATGETLSAQEIYRRVNPSVVTVMVQLSDGIGVGTGVIFTADGYILTNYHVVEGGSHCTVALDTGKVLEALYVAGDADNDLAILKADGQDLPAAEFGDSDSLVVGDSVYAIGNPLGVELRGTLTDGIVSAINRDVMVDGRTMTLIQTNAALNSGNSGGPLINSCGQVVGINTIKMSTNYATTIEGLGFALPTSVIAYMVNDLIAYGEVRQEPALGIMVYPLATLLEDGGQGIEVESVTPGSGADEAGIQAGDVIVAAEGESISTSTDLLRIRRRLMAGEYMDLRIWRNGTYMDVSVELRPVED